MALWKDFFCLIEKEVYALARDYRYGRPHLSVISSGRLISHETHNLA